jgi:hypothetical protein
MNAIGRIRAAVFVVAATTLLALALPSVASALTRAQANKIALAALRPASLKRPVVVYGLPSPLGRAQRVVEEGVRVPGGRRSLAPSGRQWVFFEDLVPGAYFDHPGRLLFVSDATGHISASLVTHSLPLIGGRAPFLEPRVPHGDRIFASQGALAATRMSTSVAHADDAVPAGAFAGECVLTVGERGPDQPNFGADLKKVKASAGDLGIPVYPLPDRPDGSAPDGKDLPAFAETLAKKGCKDILIFVAGHGDEFGTGGVTVAFDEASNTSRKVTPVNLRDTLHSNPKTTFKIVLDSCFSGKFVRWLPASFKNLLVLSVSSSATEYSYSGGVRTVIGADGQEHNNPNAPKKGEPYPPSGFVTNFTTGWKNFADSPSEVSAAQSAGGSLFAHVIAQGQALGGGLDFPASKGVEATHPMTYVLNLPAVQVGSSLKACAFQTSPTQDEVKVGEQGAGSQQGAVAFDTGSGTPQARTFILRNVTPIPDAFVGPFTAPTSGFATITVTLNPTPTGPPQTLSFTFPANSASSSDCTFPNPP